VLQKNVGGAIGPPLWCTTDLCKTQLEIFLSTTLGVVFRFTENVITFLFMLLLAMPFQVRTVLDVECGFGTFGAHLFERDLLTMCIANYEASGSQVQITLERGIPAMIGSFASKQLPYPYLSFDMVHCAKCNIEWDKNGMCYSSCFMCLSSC
jgi:hypothetical protein